MANFTGIFQECPPFFQWNGLLQISKYYSSLFSNCSTNCPTTSVSSIVWIWQENPGSPLQLRSLLDDQIGWLFREEPVKKVEPRD
ncbi:hypothetical protein EFM1CSP_19470 [Enterococcus faecium]|nr:hypothetical protein EFM1CSP_19470 [Enterococcus faecium]